MFLSTLGKAFGTTFNYKGSELLPIYFSENDIHIGKATITYPAFLSIEQVVCTISTKRSGGLCTQSIASAAGLSKSVSTFQLPGCHFRQVFLLLFFGAKV